MSRIIYFPFLISEIIVNCTFDALLQKSCFAYCDASGGKLERVHPLRGSEISEYNFQLTVDELLF